MKKAQVASMDIIIAIAIFLIAGGVFMIFFMGEESAGNSDQLNSESDLLVNELVKASDAESPNTIATSGMINQGKLQYFLEDIVDKNDGENKYDKIKSDLGIEGDFCIYFKDKDGKIVYLHTLITDDGYEFVKVDASSVADIEAFGVGSDKITLTVEQDDGTTVSLPCKADTNTN